MSVQKNILDGFITDRSVQVLVLVNILTLLMALYFSWDIFTLMLLYWLETAIIGFFTIVKIIHIGPFDSIVFIPLLLAYLWPFMYLHIFLLFAFFSNGESTSATFVPDLLAAIKTVMIPACFLFISHLYSLFVNYIRKREFFTKKAVSFLFYPMKRVAIMHIVVIAGAFVAYYLDPVFVLVLLTLLKIYFDQDAHRKLHGQNN